MAFKMKGSGLYGKGNQSPMNAHKPGHPEKKSSESVTENLLQNLNNFGTKEEQDRMTKHLNVGDTQAYLNPTLEVGTSAGGEKRQAQMVGEDAKRRATIATMQRKGSEREEKKAVDKAERQRRSKLGTTGRKAEDKDIKKANKENDKALAKDAKKGGDKPVFKKKKKY